MTTRRQWRIGGAAVAAVLVLLAAVVGIRALDDDEAAVSTDTTMSTTTTGVEPTTTTTTVVDTSTAVWPTGGSTYHDPVEAARGFAVDFVGFTDPVVGEFMQGDGRSGEVEVRAKADGAATTVFVRQLDAEHWWVLGSGTEDIVVEAPAAGDVVASPVTVTGRARAFEGTVVVRVVADGSTAVLGQGVVTGRGDGVLGPFSGSVDFAPPPSDAGAVLFLTESAEDGRVWQASVLRVRFGDPSTTTVAVFFTRGDPPSVVRVFRLVPKTTAVLQASLEQLVAGPSDDERAAGIDSWFSGDTAGMLRSVDLDPDGHAVVDFDAALATTIPGASASAGSVQLLTQLDATVEQHETVTSVEYRLDGSCAAFYEWLQLLPPDRCTG